MSSLTSFKAFFHKKPTIVVSIALGIAGPVLFFIGYPIMRERKQRPIGAPMSYPLTIRPRTYPKGYED